MALHDPVARPLWQKLAARVHYAMTDILDDLAVWLAVGILVAAAVNVFVPPGTLERWGSGLLAMVLILLVGLPMYICATASTPLGAAMLAAGVSPGTVLVFLLAGPATNFAGMAVVRRELGTRGLVAYLVGISASAIGAGLALDGLSRGWGSAAWASGSAAGGELLPAWLSMAAAMVVVACAVRPLRRSLATRLARLLARTSPAASA